MVPLLCVSACGGGGAGTEPSPVKPFTAGRSDVTTLSGGDRREYVVSVPPGYDGRTPVPLVFMLHGSSGDGPKFYNISGWKELGEEQTVLTVFPSSWHYCVAEDGEEKVTTKWNDYGLPEMLCPGSGEKPRDDVAYLRQLIAEMRQAYAVDARRIYLVGFSNGGGMASRTAVEMSDVLAGVVATAGALPGNMAFTPRRNLPLYLMVGELDDRVIENTGLDPLPMDLPTLFANPGIEGVLTTFRTSFGLRTTYALSGDPARMTTATFTGTSGAPENVLVFSVVKGMTHQYPNGTNHPLVGARLHWDFLKGFRLP